MLINGPGTLALNCREMHSTGWMPGWQPEQTGPVQDQMSVGWFARARGPGRECLPPLWMGPG
jgi:hypothetical protein